MPSGGSETEGALASRRENVETIVGKAWELTLKLGFWYRNLISTCQILISTSLALMTLSLITIRDFLTMGQPGQVTEQGAWGLNHRGWAHLIIK